MQKLEKLDGYLCELKEMQIRDGLHIFGEAPTGRLLTDLAVALVRVPRGDGRGSNQSLQRAIASGSCADFATSIRSIVTWRQTVGRHETGRSLAMSRQAMILAHQWRYGGADRIAGGKIRQRRDDRFPDDWCKHRMVMDQVHERSAARCRSLRDGEIDGILRGLDGRFVQPGPSGAPTRGRNDVLPTGRNFFSVDSRAVPTPTAWELGKKSAELLITRYRQDNGEWPTSFGLSAWGTSNMRTGGDDIAQAMALIGAKPVWDNMSRRVTGYEIITLAATRPATG